ncbi:hypothetical protein FHU31_003233 [Mycolicibacterium fluoranthenivorans]|uniref:Uncharacterized protein n=1 Tax=Mycolicibacterium fluoranthenivorans TaxID=258505 RepID=A0A7X5U0S0_9MYCO|nr:hypothetical protein [Mycolicibacterium fluoranthenivorans]
MVECVVPAPGDPKRPGEPDAELLKAGGVGEQNSSGVKMPARRPGIPLGLSRLCLLWS